MLQLLIFIINWSEDSFLNQFVVLPVKCQKTVKHVCYNQQSKASSVIRTKMFGHFKWNSIRILEFTVCGFGNASEKNLSPIKIRGLLLPETVKSVKKVSLHFSGINYNLVCKIIKYWSKAANIYIFFNISYYQLFTWSAKCQNEKMSIRVF